MSRVPKLTRISTERGEIGEISVREPEPFTLLEEQHDQLVVEMIPVCARGVPAMRGCSGVVRILTSIPNALASESNVCKWPIIRGLNAGLGDESVSKFLRDEAVEASWRSRRISDSRSNSPCCRAGASGVDPITVWQKCKIALAMDQRLCSLG